MAYTEEERQRYAEYLIKYHRNLSGHRYKVQDCDTMIFLNHFAEDFLPTRSNTIKVLEVGANEEDAARILTSVGVDVLAIDLREESGYITERNHQRIIGDFVQMAFYLSRDFDVIYSTSAVEHFGLPVYGSPKIECYDQIAMSWMHGLLKPGGICYITVPYGKEFQDEGDWRVYDETSLQQRIIGEFAVEKKIYFLSGGCCCPDRDLIVEEKDANAYSGRPPHVTVFLKLRKD